MQPQLSITTPRILWAALLMSQGIYVFLLVGGILRPPTEPPQPIMLTMISIVAMIVAGVSIVLPRVLHAQAARRLAHQEPGLLDHGQRVVLQRALQLGFTPLVLSLALSEAVAIFGLVLGAVGFHLAQCVPFFAAGLLLTLIRFPTEGRFLGPIEDAFGRRISG
jgi:hypothetical protein